MSNASDQALRPDSTPSLADRVRERVRHSSRALDRRAGASRPRLAREGNGRSKQSWPTDPVAREALALRSVYRDLGDAHRQYRRRTGEKVTPALRAAVEAFKRAPSVASLVPVAGHLDELGLLSW